jgi:hypothetical protein
MTVQSQGEEDGVVSSEQHLQPNAETAKTEEEKASPATPSQDESCSPEVAPTVATAFVSEEEPGTPQNMAPHMTTSSNEQDQSKVAPLEQVDGGTKQIDETMATHEVNQSDTKELSKEPGVAENVQTRVATPSEQTESQKPPQPADPANTTWYYVLDAQNNDWIDLEEKRAESSRRDSDELLSLVRTIKDARVSIIGTPLPGNDERHRALTNVSKENSEVLKLRGMKRTLKVNKHWMFVIVNLLVSCHSF